MQSGTVLLNDFLVTAAPAAAYYIPDFITVEEEEYLIRKIYHTPKLGWKTLGNRRLQLWGEPVLNCCERAGWTCIPFWLGGEILPKNVLVCKDMPPFLTTYPNVIARLKATSAFQFSPHQGPNHVILNEYLPGQGIMVRKDCIATELGLSTVRSKPHEDGPSYYPVVGTVSLGSHTVFHYYAFDVDATASDASSVGRAIRPTPVLSLLLESRSVIITSGDLYTSHLHGIDGVTEDMFLGEGRLRCPSGQEVVIANWQAVQGKDVRDVLHYGGTLRRETRLSMTCRDVARVARQLYR